MPFPALLLLLLVSCALGGSSQNYTFAYTLSDLVTIPYLTSIDTSSSMATSTYREIEDGELQMSQEFTQVVMPNTSAIPYNIIYFNMANTTGSSCYANYFSNGTLPKNSTSCAQIDDDPLYNLTCMLFTNCFNETFNYSINLDELEYKQSVVIIQNTLNANQNIGQNLYLNMSTYVRVYNSNGWFYWSVALTCILLLSLVLLTGVVLYWSLKLTKAQRALEELRLTEVDEEVSSIRKSMRNSIMKQE